MKKFGPGDIVEIRRGETIDDDSLARAIPEDRFRWVEIDGYEGRVADDEPGYVGHDGDLRVPVDLADHHGGARVYVRAGKLSRRLFGGRKSFAFRLSEKRWKEIFGR